MEWKINMQKKYYLIYICVLVLLCLFSCSRSEGQNDFACGDYIDSNTENSDEFPKDDNIKGEYQFSEISYILVDSANNVNINILYPQIEDLSDKNLEQKINETINSYALLLFHRFKEDIFRGNIEIEIETIYAISRNTKDIISIDFTMMFFQLYQIHPWIGKKTLNIDMTTGEKLKLKDLVNISDDFVDIFFDNFKNCRKYPPESAEETIEMVDKEIKNLILKGIINRDFFY
jgi:hypothetical protein